MMNGYGNVWGIFMMLFWVVVLVIVVAVVLRLLKQHEVSINYKLNAIDIVKERYAKGEINKDEYEQLVKDLSK